MTTPRTLAASPGGQGASSTATTIGQGASALGAHTRLVRDTRGACEISLSANLLGELGRWYGQREIFVHLTSPLLEELAFPAWATREVAALLQDPAPPGVKIRTREVRAERVRIDWLSNSVPGAAVQAGGYHEAILLIPGPAGLACLLHVLQPQVAVTEEDMVAVEAMFASLHPVVDYALAERTIGSDLTGRCRVALPARYGQGQPGLWGDGKGGLITLSHWPLADSVFANWADANAARLVGGLFASPPQPLHVERMPGRYRADFVGETQEFYAGTLGARVKVIVASVPTGADTACVLLIAFDSTRDAEYGSLANEVVASLTIRDR